MRVLRNARIAFLRADVEKLANLQSSTESYSEQSEIFEQVVTKQIELAVLMQFEDANRPESY